MTREDRLARSLRKMLDHYDRNTCTHEVTYRGGSIWTICESCGKSWADDRGGFVPYRDPKRVVEARAALEGRKR